MENKLFDHDIINLLILQLLNDFTVYKQLLDYEFDEEYIILVLIVVFFDVVEDLVVIDLIDGVFIRH